MTVHIGFSEKAPKFKVQVIVANNLSETIIIGSDFLAENFCKLDYANLSLTIQDTLIVPLLQSSQQNKPKSFKIKTTKTVTIPSKTVANNILCTTISKNSLKKVHIST